MTQLRPSPLPKYRRLAEHFRQQVAEGVLLPGDRLPSLNEMRQREGISRVTMDKVHSILEQEGLIERQPGLGTFVTYRQKKQAKGIIGLCGYGLRGGRSSAYWTVLIDGVRAQAEATGSQMLLLPHDVGDGWEKVDGVLISDLLTTHDRNLIPSQLPLVCLFGIQQERVSVVADEYTGQKQATEHLLALGHRRIAYLHSPYTNAAPRLIGYRDAMRQADIVPQRNWRRALLGKIDFGPQFIAAGRSAMASWLNDKGPNGWAVIRCTALLCRNDETALGALQAFSEVGLKVPDDVSVIGFDGTEVGEYSSPQLTSIEMPLQHMGKVAMELLQKQIAADEVVVEHKVLPTQLRVRKSTAAPPRNS